LMAAVRGAISEALPEEMKPLNGTSPGEAT